LCTFSSTCFANVDLTADIYSRKCYMLIYRVHYCYINIIKAYSFFMIDDNKKGEHCGLKTTECQFKLTVHYTRVNGTVGDRTGRNIGVLFKL
jgi:hypothetical protein